MFFIPILIWFINIHFFYLSAKFKKIFYIISGGVLTICNTGALATGGTLNQGWGFESVLWKRSDPDLYNKKGRIKICVLWKGWIQIPVLWKRSDPDPCIMKKVGSESVFWERSDPNLYFDEGWIRIWNKVHFMRSVVFFRVGSLFGFF